MRRITRAPIVEYSYPAGFPDADANCVESEQIQADREFNENMAAGCSFREHEKLHRRRIMRVFLTFALRACNLKTPGPWSIVRIRSEVAEFVEAQVTAAGMDWNRPEVRESFEKTPEWAAYEDALLMAASGEGGLPKANQSGATEPSGNESTRTEEGPAVNGTNGSGADRRVAIDAFISKLAETGRKVTRKDVWTVPATRAVPSLSVSSVATNAQPELRL